MATTEPSAAQRRLYAKMHIAMPDGSYYVRNRADLQNAIDAVGRGEDGDPEKGNAIRKFIIGRAQALKLVSMIPATWNSDGTLKHEDPIEAFLAHFEPTDAQRKEFAKSGVAMPDGSYYIRNAADLDNAIRAVGRARPNTDEEHNAVRRHIMARAQALGLSKEIPDSWNSDGSLKHMSLAEEAEEYLKHFGVKGMHWGVRKDGSPGSSHVSEDAARSHALQATVKKHGTNALSNQDLQHLVTRLNLEAQHTRLNPAHVSTGQKIVHELLGVGGSVAKQQATAFGSKYAAEGIEHLIKKAGK